MTFEDAAGRLRGNAGISESRSVVCRVHEAGSTKDGPLFTVEFVHPDRWADWPDRLSADQRYYRMGLIGTADRKTAFLGFRCDRGLGGAGGLGGPAPPVVGASLDLWPDRAHTEIDGPERGHLLMTVLHSAARTMAGKLGCLERSGLPAAVPAPAPPSAYRKPPALRGPRG
ncbi:hypothetical protein [Streptomyces sp. I05A-00742]|uniref:hypothetical protein n=1 Tax=Streptomyces sp. I05A-00742 TaxID=2732853 RepID=UPI001487D4CE|nr:hypothetical protein [Streptomyces sp. I05A-00742]